VHKRLAPGTGGAEAAADGPLDVCTGGGGGAGCEAQRRGETENLRERAESRFGGIKRRYLKRRIGGFTMDRNSEGGKWTDRTAG